MNKQTISDSEIGGSVTTKSTGSNSEQTIIRTKIKKDLNQEINEPQNMRIGNMSAKGNIAIICLAIVIIIFVAYQIIGL
ncbi:hypothetical protein [Herpetosiphon gulosus]|uniref:Uncharacterized protein n=1 Tax=Herpetosiphon gulosus TaxID=1973496 RepID=A0ABP9X161_9CHLR